MMRHIVGLVAAIIVLTSVLSAAGAAGQVRKTVRYACAGGGSVTVTYGSGWADVVVGGRSSRLNAAPSAAGTRYSDGRWVWRLTGGSGELTRDGRMIARSCRTK